MNGDLDLRQRFEELRDEERSSVPPFFGNKSTSTTEEPGGTFLFPS